MSVRLGEGIDWDHPKPKDGDDKVADALEAVAAALTSLNRPAPPRQPVDNRAALADAASVVAGMRGNAHPDDVARAVALQMSPDTTDPARASWIMSVNGWTAALMATRSGPLNRHVDAIVAFSKVLNRPPSTITRREYEPLAEAFYSYVLNATVAVKAEAVRQRVMGPA